MSTSTTSGEISMDTHSLSRSASAGAEQAVDAAKTGSVSHVAVPETSVIIGKRLAKMTAKFEENTAAIDTDNAHLSQMVQAQIASAGEIAVLAAANQLPDAAMSFSTSVE
jgi:hypothetical protein